MMKFCLTYLFSVCGMLLPATAQVADTVSMKIAHNLSYREDFRQQVHANPAMQYFKHDYSLSTLSVLATGTSAKESRIATLGKGERHFGFEAESHVRLNGNSCIWGDASYLNGEKDEVKWNETSDFLLLYPYVMGDSIGGDMRFEQYYLNGGYAAQYGRLHYGATLCYRALTEYRTVDPRPNNVVADLKAQIALGILFGKYSLAASVHAGKYKQTNEVKYFDELGASKEYHLTGLGTEFVRFSGASNNVFYKGHSFGGSLEWSPTDKNGFSVSMRFNRFQFDKILSDLNKLSLNHLYENALNGEIAWIKGKRDVDSYGLKLDLAYSKRRGSDNMFGDASGNVYPQIGSILMFKNHKATGKVSGFYEQSAGKRFSLGVSPYLAYTAYESIHTGSGNRFDVSNLIFGTSAKAAYAHRHNLLQLFATAMCRINRSTVLQLSEEDVRNHSLRDMLGNMEKYFSANENAVELKLRYDRSLSSGTKTVFFETSWQHGIYQNGRHENLYYMKAGISL